MASLASVTESTFGQEPALRGFRLTSPGGRVSAVVAPEDGGGLASLALAGHGELLYRACEFAAPPAGEWMGRAPLLWPAVGRNYAGPEATDFSYVCDGQVCPMPIHGFARSLPWQPSALLADDEQAAVRLTLSDSDATRPMYPRSFHAVAMHCVDDRGWSLAVSLASDAPLRFGIGNHLTLRLPKGPDYDRVLVSSSARSRLGLSDRGLLSGAEQPVDLTHGVPLSQDWLASAALGGLDEDAWLAVRYPSGVTVRVTQSVSPGEEYTVAEDRLFVLYGQRERGYFCPEPWLGWPDGLQTGRGAVDLPPRRSFTWTMRVDLLDAEYPCLEP
jgi:galactose mutarotase-like enzyme